MTTYVQQVIDQLSERLPDCDRDLINLYALLALSTGASTTLEDVHDAWAVWRVATRPDHPAVVPFSELSEHTRELDRPYMNAIHQVSYLHGRKK